MSYYFISRIEILRKISRCCTQRPCNFLKIPSLFEHDEIEIKLRQISRHFFPPLLHPPKQSIDNYTVDLLNCSCDKSATLANLCWYTRRSDKLYYALRRMHEDANKNINFSGSLVKRAGVQLASSLSLLFVFVVHIGIQHKGTYWIHVHADVVQYLFFIGCKCSERK